MVELQAVSDFIACHLERLSEICRSDRKHKVAKRTKKIELLEKEQSEEGKKQQSVIIVDEVVDGEGSSKAAEEPPEDEVNNEGGDGSVMMSANMMKVDLNESVNWQIIAKWLLGVRIRQLCGEVN
jgi:hypothetical protein